MTVEVNIHINSVTAIEQRAKKASEMGLDGENEYLPETIAYFIYKNAFELEKKLIQQRSNP